MAIRTLFSKKPKIIDNKIFEKTCVFLNKKKVNVKRTNIFVLQENLKITVCPFTNELKYIAEKNKINIKKTKKNRIHRVF
jgi:hypothetical protein